MRDERRAPQSVTRASAAATPATPAAAPSKTRAPAAAAAAAAGHPSQAKPAGTPHRGASSTAGGSGSMPTKRDLFQTPAAQTRTSASSSLAATPMAAPATIESSAAPTAAGPARGASVAARLRAKIRELLSRHAYDSAAFWADKLVVIDAGDRADTLLLARCFHLSGQHARAIELIRRHGSVAATAQRAMANAVVASEPLDQDEETSEHNCWRLMFDETQDSALRLDAMTLFHSGRVDSQPSLAAQYASSSRNTSAASRAPALKSAECRFLAALCHFALKEYEDAQEMLCSTIEDMEQACDDYASLPLSVASAICVLRGRVFETLDNRSRATRNYIDALHLDVYCHEALEQLVSQRLLTPLEAAQLMVDLQPAILAQAKDDAPLLVELYLSDTARLGPISSASLKQTSALVRSVGKSTDVLVNQAEQLYQLQHSVLASIEITRHVLELDPYHERCLVLHLCCLVSLGETSDLFALGHRLVKSNPDWAIAWLAVGCYYLTTGNSERARRYFTKATSYDVHCAPAWVAIGHSLIAEGEYDTALAAYSTASRLLPGSYLPLVFSGICYLRNNNIAMADLLFNQAHSIDATDPLVLCELGVVAFRNGDYHGAKARFVRGILLSQAMNKTKSPAILDVWEPLVFNLAHCHRKLGEYADAIKYYEWSAALFPRNASVLTALAFCYQLEENFASAIELYHKALSLNPDEPLVSDLLPIAMRLMRTSNSSSLQLLK
ncbi:hypothetical protein CAOG_01306 [Capsaspora owczarzaki ATCC 30864]|uniref:Uncharacterized protein n=1 Tax=Capsaspora owczarzaki (strain ATCC 30864) TaxID=595528 RepID=A0A0D2U3Y1_CAPO3|nr:hypothetical protein CAOG_01306 [Capsaspora owczarzaki ATCC 30864]KJE89901.1 hypothetical protein CAOG_001306 [Capsaspora owczarzaki ATCC 30864]|eukprot:XP_004349826.2 hypothetical protein CAOG_01306 [Capsaspora owczarzaki ATCC 30864]